jgi:hypothetical protein
MTGAIGFQSGIPRGVAKNAINHEINPLPEGRGLLADKIKYREVVELVGR